MISITDFDHDPVLAAQVAMQPGNQGSKLPAPQGALWAREARGSGSQGGSVGRQAHGSGASVQQDLGAIWSRYGPNLEPFWNDVGAMRASLELF